jgi:hypothetical protein
MSPAPEPPAAAELVEPLVLYLELVQLRARVDHLAHVTRVLALVVAAAGGTNLVQLLGI